MMRLPRGSYHLVWLAECWNWLKFTHTQSDETKRDSPVNAMVHLVVLAKEIYVGRSVLRSKTPCVKQSSESIVKRILLKFW